MPTTRMKSKSERGQSMVEFAFGFVVLLLLLSGAVDGGRALDYPLRRLSLQENPGENPSSRCHSAANS